VLEAFWATRCAKWDPDVPFHYHARTYVDGGTFFPLSDLTASFRIRAANVTANFFCCVYAGKSGSLRDFAVTAAASEFFRRTVKANSIVRG
jgi:hypothetical protein